MNDTIAPAVRLPDWAEGLVNLASVRFGTRAIRCSDDSFAPMERMLHDTMPVFKPHAYDDFGKWMDGWESKRRRDGGHDWCIIHLGVRGRVRGVDLDTSFFTGNYPPAAVLYGSDSKQEPRVDDSDAWQEIIPLTTLGPDAHHFVETTHDGVWQWVKLAIHPDGGIARLRLYGEAVSDWRTDDDGVVELSALKNGGRVVAYNDAHYGEVWAVLSEGRGVNMCDGWETRRRREPGHDWLIVQLGAEGRVEHIEVDTAHFKGNYPTACSVQAARVTGNTEASVIAHSMFWSELMPQQPLGADAVHRFSGKVIEALGAVTHVRLNIFPDGGISRFRVYGRLQ